MVAVQRIRRNTASELLVDSRRSERKRVALRAWICTEQAAHRGYALDLSSTGARFGGMGRKLKVGDVVIAKIVIIEQEAPLILRAEVVRYAPASSCPEVCVRFFDAQRQALPELLRLSDLIEA